MATEETKPVEREAFEKWAQPELRPIYRMRVMVNRQPYWSQYEDDITQTAWEAWQASADAALERAETRLRWMGLETAADVVLALKGSR